MHDLGILIPIVAIASWPIGWVANTWIRARHGYALTDEKGELREHDVPIAERNRFLSAENEEQRAQIAALHQRLAVLERIATDPAARVAADIDGLR